MQKKYWNDINLPEEGFTDISNSQMRSAIARRLVESKSSAPHFYLTMEINMDNAISARTQMNEVSPVKISFNDLVVKGVAWQLIRAQARGQPRSRLQRNRVRQVRAAGYLR